MSYKPLEEDVSPAENNQSQEIDVEVQAQNEQGHLGAGLHHVGDAVLHVGDQLHDGVDGVTGAIKDNTLAKAEQIGILEYLMNPVAYCPMCILFGGGIYGLLSVIFVSIGRWHYQFAVAIVLMIVGFLAAFEVRLQGSMSQNIKVLEHQVKNMDEVANRLGGDVTELQNLRDRYDGNIKKLREEGDDLAKQGELLNEMGDKLDQQKLELVQESERLSGLNEKTEEENQKLLESEKELNQTIDDLSNTMEEFDGLRLELEKIAENEGQDVQELVNTMNSSYNNWNDLVIQQNRTSLLNSAYEWEMETRGKGDGAVGWTLWEFQRWSCALRPRYQKAIKESKLDFEKIKGDDDIIDQKEMKELIDFLVNEVDVKEIKNKNLEN